MPNGILVGYAWQHETHFYCKPHHLECMTSYTFGSGFFSSSSKALFTTVSSVSIDGSSEYDLFGQIMRIQHNIINGCHKFNITSLFSLFADM